ncbi:Hypothetical predicted protein [Olea europaea subsp. europaea]|uniref:Myb/SANT-like domain-containing protein n=1 Tax=Olea europaea subsp. europaea TaxID=158383 RepID=A0A8S0TGF6_OLEEU|nr:Hypothetical predicted protein [Olea europaea subsp. europaea]
MATPIYQYAPSLIFCSQSHDLLSDFAQFLLPFEDGPQIQSVQSLDNSNSSTLSTLGYRLTRLDLNPFDEKVEDLPICRPTTRTPIATPELSMAPLLSFSWNGRRRLALGLLSSEHEPIPAATPFRRSDRRIDTQKCAKWDPQEHHIFISMAEHITAEGHRRGKCFTTVGWERIWELFNKRAGEDWTVTQLENHWSVIRTNHKLLMELLRFSGIHYELNSGGRIKANDWLWEQKIKENPKYGKFRYNDNNEIFHTYGKLFGATQDSTKYALTPMKLSQHDLDVSSNCDAQVDFNDMLLINAETTDSCDGPAEGRLNSLMDIFVGRSGEKRRGK